MRMDGETRISTNELLADARRLQGAHLARAITRAMLKLRHTLARVAPTDPLGALLRLH